MKQAFIDHECECILYYCILQILSLVFELVYNMSKTNLPVKLDKMQFLKDTIFGKS